MKWVPKKLGDILHIARGGSPRPINSFITQEDNGINWIKIGDTKEGSKYIESTKQKIKQSGISKSRYVKKGDFLLSNSMSFGRPYILKIDGCIHDGWLVLSNYQETFKSDYLYYLLSSHLVQNQFEKLARGSTVRNLNIDLVSNVIVPIPPLEKQQRIVDKLEIIFAEIENSLKSIKDTKDNLNILFKKFSDKNFFEGHKDWITMEMGELCEEIFAGGDVQKNRLSKIKTGKFNIPIFTNGEKNKGLYGFTDKARVIKPSITISARGTIGYSELRTEPFYPAVRLIVATPNNHLVETDYLKYAIKNLTFVNTGASIPQLTTPMVKKYKIKLPKSKDEQKKVVERFEKLNLEINKLMNILNIKVQNYNILKKTILNKELNNKKAA